MVEYKQLVRNNIDFEIKQLSVDKSQHLVKFNGLLNNDDRFYVLNKIRREFCNLEFVAITRMEVHENTSFCADEFVGKRLNLLPIDCTNSDYLVSTWDCYCDDYCQNCSIMYELDVTAEHADIVVTSDMLQGPDNFKVVPGITLVVLRKGQRLKLKLHAQKGTARQHACFKHVNAYYTPDGDFYIETIGTCDPEQALLKVLEQLQTSSLNHV